MIDFLANRFNYGFYLGETLWIGNLGHFFIVLSFVLSGLAAFSFFKAEQTKDKGLSKVWNKIARNSYYIHGISIFAIFALLFYMIFNHHFEYHYAWSHSSKDLPVYYIISSFWEGQEGSFLLWQFWHVILGFILIKIAKDYENRVMTVMAFTQMLLGTMVLGVHIFGIKIGMNPFVLLRDVMSQAPIFAKADYLSFIEDGNGLNLLLQNYWMVIHPPVLFLGFALTVVPFAYAIASLWKADYTSWLRPALAWSLATIAFLGLGIFMGGAWAYESLSFGGFWAWDPVENASLVPWLLIVAGTHTLVAYKYTKRGLGISYLLLILTFIFILYSTFLTRSGVLGDTSVHSFTDLGMTGQLLIYMALLSIPAIILLIYRMSKIPKEKGEEAFLSREFWIFIGSLIFIISAAQITWDTSLPVVNKIFGSNLALDNEVVAHYNKVQIIIGILLAIGAAFVQFLSYKTGRLSKYFKYLGLTVGLALVTAIFLGFYFNFPFIIEYSLGESKIPFISTYWMLLFTGFFALYSNIAYILLVVKNKFWQWSGSISHIGFALFILGTLISQGKQLPISINAMGINYGEGFEGEENQTNILLPEGDTLVMGKYWVSYEGRKTDIHNDKKELFNVSYYTKNTDGSYTKDFELHPDAQINAGMGLVSNPDTKRFLTHDIFTHVTSIPEKPKDPTAEVTEMHIGDTVFTSKHYVILEKFISNPVGGSLTFNDTLMGLGALLSVNGFDGFSKELMPLYAININNSTVINPILTDYKTNLEFQLLKFNPQTESVELAYKDKEGSEDFIIMKAIVFPYINVLWIGGIIMLLGALMSAFKRYFNK
ncbi:MAG: cytochrome c biogenesis protein CcsA [Chitinophagales bacterium]|nr:cytochrome c biogenesis protein CcsA [Chitinophagales bacterium]